MLNANIPSFAAYVNTSWLTKDNTDTSRQECYVFGIQSVSGKMLTFHIITTYGAVRSRVPLSELYLFLDTPKNIPYHYKQLWDSFSENVTVIQYDYLKNRKCQVLLKDNSIIQATYLFTVDWYDNPYSDNAYDYKCAHILKADDGYLLAQPNNRIIKWHDTNFCNEERSSNNGNASNWRVDREIPSVEHAPKWVENTDKFQY
jgi:hypothetical protein